MAINKDEQVLKSNCPHIVVGTPGRILALVRSKKLNLKNLKHFILDECDKMLEQLGETLRVRESPRPVSSRFVSLADMRRDVQEIFRATPHEKVASCCPRCTCAMSSPIVSFAASHDVLRHSLQGNQTRLQEVHARCTSHKFSG